MKNKKTMITIISIVALLLLLIGITYAYWLVTKTQTNSNIISSACLDITLDNESNDISLSSQYPMSDEEGMKLTPYTFTVTNNCNTSIDYQVALEAIGDETSSISSSALQVALDGSADLLSNRASVSSTIGGVYAAHRLGYGTLAASGSEGSSVTHSLRIWIDESAPISEANKTFQSKISVTIGQGIKNSPYAEGTLAYDILANNDEATTLSAVWSSGTPATATYNSLSKTANYWYGTEYTLDTETGKYQLSGTLVQATLTECREGTKACGEYTLKTAKQDYSTTTLYKITSFTNTKIADTTSTLYMTTQSITAKNDFSVATVDGEGGLYKTVDDLGDSYYFRGDVTNNYVQFGKYEERTEEVTYYKVDSGYYYEDVIEYNTLEECESAAWNDYDADSDACQAYEVTIHHEETPMYWRIVRINGDGTIRLVYDGTTKAENGTVHTANVGMTAYSDNESESKSVGYTYNKSVTDTTQIDSDIKVVVDTWYNNNLKTKYGTYIADGIFCNDREVTEAYYYDEEWEETTKENAYYTDYTYAPYTRLAINKTPRLTCTNKSDRYTTNESTGNGLLSNPVGLLTADEAFFAGGTTATNQTYYLYSGEYYWTSAPYDSSWSGDGATVWYVSSGGYVGHGSVSLGYGARPVINLKADVLFEGNGSFETPYVIKTN